MQAFCLRFSRYVWLFNIAIAGNNVDRCDRVLQLRSVDRRIPVKF
jgi:hypothetical protein